MSPPVMLGLTVIWLAAIIFGPRLVKANLRWLWLAAPLVAVGWMMAFIGWCARNGQCT